MIKKFQIDKADQVYCELIIFKTLVSILVIIGLIFIYSSSCVYALEKFADSHYFVKKQFWGLTLGLIGMFICSILPIKLIKFLTPAVFIISLLFTGITVVPGLGQTINGSKRWLNLFGFVFQPSEALKMALIIYIAYLLAKKYINYSQTKSLSFSSGYMPFMIPLALVCLILLKQPDFGQAVTCAVSVFIMLFIAGCKLSHLLYTALILVPGAVLLIAMKSYRLKRILTFLNPWQDPQGAGFQVIQSLIAIGSGGIFGVGIAQSKQKFFYLPMQCTDFIFSIIAEETGFFGALILILLYLGFLYFGFKLATKFKDPFALYTTIGFVVLTSLQAVINIFVTAGLLPTKGLGLPFVSYGISALLCNLCMVGLINNFAKNN